MGAGGEGERECLVQLIRGRGVILVGGTNPRAIRVSKWKHSNWKRRLLNGVVSGSGAFASLRCRIFLRERSGLAMCRCRLTFGARRSPAGRASLRVIGSVIRLCMREREDRWRRQPRDCILPRRYWSGSEDAGLKSG